MRLASLKWTQKYHKDFFIPCPYVEGSRAERLRTRVKNMGCLLVLTQLGLNCMGPTRCPPVPVLPLHRHHSIRRIRRIPASEKQLQ